MKRLLTLGLIMTMSVGMIGCGNNDDIQESEPEPVIQEEVKLEEVNKTEEEVEDIQEEVEDIREEVESIISEVEIEKVWKSEYRPIVNEWNLLHMTDSEVFYNLAYIDEDDYPELILYCDEGYNIYTIINEEAVKIVINEEENGPYTESGWQLKDGKYMEKNGVWGTYKYGLGVGFDAYKIIGETTDFIFSFGYSGYQIDEDGTYLYMVSYNNEKGETVTVEGGASADDDFFLNDLKNVVDTYEFEKKYDFSMENERDLFGEYTYADMCEILEIEERELTDQEKYAKLLSQFMKDSDCCLLDILDCIIYGEGMRFALKDINHDGRDELLIENNIFIPGDDWNNSQVGIVHYYDGQSGIYARIDGDMGGKISYYELVGNEEKLKDVYSWVEYDSEDFGETLYYHGIAPGNGGDGIQITEEEYMTQPCYNWRRDGEIVFEADYHEISYENIHKYLLTE